MFFFCHVFVVVGFIVVVAVVLSFVVKVAVIVVVVIFKAFIHAARMVTELFHRGVQTLIQITQKPFFSLLHLSINNVRNNSRLRLRST